MKVLTSKIVNGKKMFLIEDNNPQGKVFAQVGKPIKKENISYYNPYYVDVKGINPSDNVSTKLTPSRKITPQELKQIKESSTNVGNIALKEKQEKAQRLKEALKEKQEKAQRLKEAEEAYQKRKSGDPVTPELLAQETQAIGDKISLQNIPGVGQYIPDILDITGAIGSMASNLGALPLNLNRGNYGQALLSVAAPLATGALAGIGTQNTGQFANNLINPFAGTGQIIDKLGNKYLPNAYKLNPFAFKPDPEAFYRQIGKSAYDDAITKGRVFSKGQENMLERVPELNYLDEYNKSIALNKTDDVVKQATSFVDDVTPKKQWYDNFHLGELSNELPINYKGDFIERGVAKESALNDFFNTGIIRNNKSAGLPLNKRSSNYGERVFFGPSSESSILPRNNYTFKVRYSDELKNRPVTFNDVEDIIIKNTDGTYSSMPNWKDKFKNHPNYKTGADDVTKAGNKTGKFNLTKPSEAPFVQKGELFFPINRKPTGKGYKGTKYADAEYLLEGKLPNEAVLPRYQQKYFPTLKESSNVGVIRPEFNELNNFNVYKRDWLKGYKQINVPKSQLKSAIGNNGMFDMTNPNIYKTLILGAMRLGALNQTNEKQFGGTIKVLDTKIENNKKYYLINDIEKNNTFEKGGTVSDIYKQKTGKNWNTAKLEGLTTGSYEDNIKLRQRLLAGEFDNKQLNTNSNNNISNPTKIFNNYDNNQDYTKAKDFNEAFKIARNQLGANQIFEYQGRQYGTNIVGEKFEPSKDVLEKAGMNTTNVKKSLHEQNKLVNSVYSTKKTTKLEPEYQDWEKIKQRQQEINKMNQADIIKEYHKGSNEQYLVLDKKRAKLHLYQGDKEITSYNVGTGANVGDEQTKTIVKNGKVYWEEGNKMTGAGIYTVSGVNPKNPHYSNAPTWNFKNEQGIEVPMAIHSSFGDRTSKIKDNKEDNNRLSNGCINGICYNLKELYKKGYKQGQKLYVLPDDDTNKYEIKNGKLIFSSKNPNVNKTVNTLNYKPIQIQYNKSLRENAPEVANMTQAIVNNKQKLMKELKINGDVYNELAKLTLGLAGQESKYGTSFKFKAKTELIQDILKNIIGNKSYNSKGLTQIKYDGLNDEVKKIFKEYNITKENLNQGDKAALAQIILLSHMYNNELPAYRKNIDEMGISDIDALLYLNQGKRKELINKTATPEKNTYIQSVKKFAEDFKIKQLN